MDKPKVPEKKADVFARTKESVLGKLMTRRKEMDSGERKEEMPDPPEPKPGPDNYRGYRKIKNDMED